MNTQTWLDDYVNALEQLTPETVTALAPLLNESLEFKDPFNHSHHANEFLAVLQDMYQRIDDVKFTVHTRIQQGEKAAIYWTYSASSRITGPFSFTGMSHLCADAEGKITQHIDVWDASDLMQQLPMLGGLIRWLKRRFSHS